MEERRRYPRVKASIFYRPAAGKPPVPAADVSLGGMRILTDDRLKKGSRLEIEIFLPDNTTMEAVVQVVWRNRLEKGSQARFEVGVEFLDVPVDGRDRLEQVLEPYVSEAGAESSESEPAPGDG